MDYAIDPSGNGNMILNAIESTCLHRNGVLLAPTGTLKDFNIGIDVLMMYRTIIGCCEGDSIPQWIQLYKEGRFPVDRIIHTYSFEELEKARDDAHRGKVMKAVVAMH